MTLPAQDIVERLRERAKYHAQRALEYATTRPLSDNEHKTSVLISESADTISRLTADNEALRNDNARLSEEKEALAFGMRHGQSLSEDAIHAIRELLNEAGVPLAAFIDDHVGNAIVQRNQARAKGTALEAEVGRLRDSLELYANEANWKLGGPCDPNSPHFAGVSFARAALANEEAGR